MNVSVCTPVYAANNFQQLYISDYLLTKAPSVN